MNSMADDDYYAHEFYFQDDIDDVGAPTSSIAAEELPAPFPYQLPASVTSSQDATVQISEQVADARARAEAQGRALTLQSVAAELFAVHGHRLKIRHTPAASTVVQRMSRPSHNFLVFKGPSRADDEIIIDVNFRERFLLGRTTPHYDTLLSLLPTDFVGPLELLLDTVFVISDAMDDVFKHHQMFPVPPWRKYKNMAHLWDYRRRQRDYSIPKLGILSSSVSSVDVAIHDADSYQDLADASLYGYANTDGSVTDSNASRIPSDGFSCNGGSGNLSQYSQYSGGNVGLNGCNLFSKLGGHDADGSVRSSQHGDLIPAHLPGQQPRRKLSLRHTPAEKVVVGFNIAPKVKAPAFDPLPDVFHEAARTAEPCEAAALTMGGAARFGNGELRGSKADQMARLSNPLPSVSEVAAPAAACGSAAPGKLKLKRQVSALSAAQAKGALNPVPKAAPPKTCSFGAFNNYLDTLLGPVHKARLAPV